MARAGRFAPPAALPLCSEVHTPRGEDVQSRERACQSRARVCQSRERVRQPRVHLHLEVQSRESVGQSRERVCQPRVHLNLEVRPSSSESESSCGGAGFFAAAVDGALPPSLLPAFGRLLSSLLWNVCSAAESFVAWEWLTNLAPRPNLRTSQRHTISFAHAGV